MDIFKLTKISLSFLILICLAAFLGCSGNNGEEKPIKGNFEEWGLDGKTEMQIKQDYLDAFIKPDFVEATIEDVWIEKFYGIYNLDNYKDSTLYSWDMHMIVYGDGFDRVAVIMGSSFDKDDTPWEETVYRWDETIYTDIFAPPVEQIFCYNNGNRILVWKKGIFYTLQEVLYSPTTPLLHRIDVRQIASYHAGLSMEQERQIKQIIVDSINEYLSNIYPDMHLRTINCIKFDRFYGIYAGQAVVLLYTDAWDYNWTITIAGESFSLPYPLEIWVWNEEGEAYSLEYAYEEDLLTDDDIKTIAYIHRTRKVIPPGYIGGK